MATEHAGLLQDTHFWVLLATLGFAALAYKKGKAPLLSMLDGRTARIKADLEEAEKLRLEAQDLLADCQKKHRDALQTSQKIIDNAKETATRLQKESEKKLEESLKRKEAQLLERISRAETAAIAELRNQAADIAVKASETLLTDALTKRGAKMVDESIAEIPARMN